MFPNLQAEMTRYGITYANLGKIIGKSSSWIDNRLRGKASLSVGQAILIHDEFFPELTYGYLFAREPISAKTK